MISLATGTLPQWGSFIALMTILAGCITVWIRGIPERFRVRTEARQIEIAEADLIRKELREQIQAERLEHSTEMRALNLERDDMNARLSKMEKLLGRQQLRHNAERSLDRHRLNNINQCFDALLLLLKANPNKVSEAIAMVEDMRAKQLLAETEEKAIIRAAEITADECEVDHDGN